MMRACFALPMGFSAQRSNHIVFLTFSGTSVSSGVVFLCVRGVYATGAVFTVIVFALPFRIFVLPGVADPLLEHTSTALLLDGRELPALTLLTRGKLW
jgi:hypothetical protein